MQDATTTEPSTALTIPAPTQLAALFASEKGIDDLIARIEREARSHAPDLTTAKGRDAIKSLAFKVAKSKTALDEAGKSLNDERRAAISAVDAERRKVRDRLDALKDEVRKPLTEWEAKEEARVADLESRFAAITTGGLTALDASSAIASRLETVRAMGVGGDWQEFADRAADRIGHTLDALEGLLTASQRREADEAELARLREEAAIRAEADRIRAEREAAAQRERLAAEQAERDRIARERDEADRAARIEKEKKEAAAQAARDAEQRAKREAEETAARHAKELADAKAREEAAAQRERDRIASEQRAEAAARAKREADQAHRARIRDEIAESLKTQAAGNWSALADAMMDGKIPHVRVVL